MKMNFRALMMSSVVLAGWPVLNAVAAGSAPTGLWYDHTGRGAVEITDCGGRLCGRIAWLKAGVNAKGCGIQVLGNVPQKGPGLWEGGWIYDPEEDSKYDVEVTQIGADKLKILGYAGVKLLGETMMWTRAPAELPRCKS